MYRGTEFPTMQGLYFFSDICSDEIGYVDAANPADITYSEQFDGNTFVTFGEDVEKKLYIAGLAGIVYRVVDADLLSVDDITQETAVSIYPTPANDQLTIEFSRFTQAETLTIFDITGKLIKSFSIQDLTTTVSISDLTSGVYIAQLETSGYTQKLIVN